MTTRLVLALSAAITLAPELLRVVNDERQRRHDAKQRDKDRENAREVARINAEGTKP